MVWAPVVQARIRSLAAVEIKIIVDEGAGFGEKAAAGKGDLRLRMRQAGGQGFDLPAREGEALAHDAMKLLGTILQPLPGLGDGAARIGEAAPQAIQAQIAVLQNPFGGLIEPL